MRRPLALVTLTFLLLHGALARAGWQARLAASAEMGVGTLERAVLATGGSLESATLFLDGPVADPGVAERLSRRMGWAGEPSAGEQRTVEFVNAVGGRVLRLTWHLTGHHASRWKEHHSALLRALAAEGVRAPVQVELAGRVPAADGPLPLAHAALDGVRAGSRQPWSDERAASVAGWSPLLPPGPYEVNVQVAVRREVEGSRFWIGWPAVRSDY